MMILIAYCTGLVTGIALGGVLQRRSLRDYFAAKALNALVVNHGLMYAALGETAYKIADALLAARSIARAECGAK